MNDFFATLNLLDWKPLLTALLLPPAPLLLLVLLAWWWRRHHAALAAGTLSVALLGLWFTHCQVTAALLEQGLATAPVLSPTRLADLRRQWRADRSVVLVLGGGVRSLATEYGEAHLGAQAMERLHYGLWLGRQMKSPVMVSGGLGHAQPAGPPEAEVAARIASRDYGQPLRWIEAGSRDTRENAHHSLNLLQREGVTDVLLVTHGWHMPRAMRNFEQAAARTGRAWRIVPAPLGMPVEADAVPALRWLPSADGQARVRQALREWAGWLAGA